MKIKKNFTWKVAVGVESIPQYHPIFQGPPTL